MRSEPELPDPKRLYQFFAAKRRASSLKLAKYVLCPFGLTESVGDVNIDGEFVLRQGHPDALLYLCPMKGRPQPTASAAWYYADCIAFEHDIPVIVLPTRGDFDRYGYRFAHSGQTKPRIVHGIDTSTGEAIARTYRGMSAKRAVKEYYCESLCDILENVRQIRQGPMTFVDFRHAGMNETVSLPYSAMYRAAKQEIHLYAVALRQVDTLSEFLCYYRVIESATGTNGKRWIASSLDVLPGYDFGFIAIGHEFARRRRNLLSIWRQRAVRRLSDLRNRFGSANEIARYLYNTTRCGIAHGNQIVKADLTPSYFEVVRDTCLLKLLARMVIGKRLEDDSGTSAERSSG